LRIGAGIKNKLLEALAMGIPVVASPLSIEGISAEPELDLLLAETAEMPERILRLLQNKTLQKELSARGRPLIEKYYSWQSVAERYIKLYQSL
jgi:polysaccharide biosynthesis protein PslH